MANETDLSAFRVVFRLVLSGLVEPGGIFGEVLQAGECATQQFGGWRAVVGNVGQEAEHAEQGALAHVGRFVEGQVTEIARSMQG